MKVRGDLVIFESSVSTSLTFTGGEVEKFLHTILPAPLPQILDMPALIAIAKKVNNEMRCSGQMRRVARQAKQQKGIQ